jgi:hypothetical protein
MPIDALGYEPQFLDHLAAVWMALPERGRFLTDPSLVEYARGKGIDAEGLAVDLRLPFIGKPDRKALVASYGDMKKGRRLGYGNFARFEHGIGQNYGTKHPSYAGGADADDVSLFLVPNEYSGNLWHTVYPDVQVDVVGSPRLDGLPRRGSAGRVVAVSWHWRCDVAPETQPAFPHFARVLPELARRYTVLGHGHPRIIDDLAPYYVKAGIEVVRDFDEVCRRADLYACDNSSTMYEFASTGRPVLTLNAPGYRRTVHFGLRFWDAADVGLQVDEPAELIPAVAAALADPLALRRARERALALVYTYRTGAAQRAARRLSAWAAEPAMAVA